MRRLAEWTVQIFKAALAATLVVAVHACAPTHAGSGPSYLGQALAAHPYLAPDPGMDVVRLGGD